MKTFDFYELLAIVLILFPCVVLHEWAHGFVAWRLGDPTQQALLLAAVCLLFILFAVLRSRVQQLLTRGVFRRPELDRAFEWRPCEAVFG